MADKDPVVADKQSDFDSTNPYGNPLKVKKMKIENKNKDQNNPKSGLDQKKQILKKMTKSKINI